MRYLMMKKPTLMTNKESGVKPFYVFILVLMMFGLSACSPSGPGPLEGKWRLEGGLIPMTVIYTDTTEESMGIISNVSYRHDGNDIYVTYESGIAEGHSVRFTRVNNSTFASEFGTLRRVR